MNRERHGWLDVVKGVAMAWIFLGHIVEKVVCCPAFGNPGPDWPSLAGRVEQLRPLPIGGIDGLFMNAFRYVGWLSDLGVQIFVVASGFGLALSALRSPTLGVREFYARRLMRIVPLWWAAHIFFIVVSFVASGLPYANWHTWASFAGLRFLPSVMYYFTGAWWFFGLILQLYAIFPWLARWLRDWTLGRFAWVVVGGLVLVRLAGLLVTARHAPQLLDWWSRGALFVPRLPEFAFGMILAALVHRRPADVERWFRGPRAVVGALLVLLAGIASLFTLVGLSMGMLLSGAGFVVLFQALAPQARGIWRPAAWLGRNSLAFFLVHHPVVSWIGPSSTASVPAILVRTVAAFGLSLVLGYALERVTLLVVARVTTAWNTLGASGTLLRVGALLALCGIVPIVAELAVRRFDPQEVAGFGERPSLQADPRYGFHLIPGQVTRLRWLSYDYTVRANDFGFPGPDYPRDRAPDALRILVTGDAFESAEGVDTADSWPRLLETELTRKIRPTRVSNFSVTGWGPNQYAQVVEDFAESHAPELIIVGFFVNDYDDVLVSNADFERFSGVAQPPPNPIAFVAKLPHLRSFLRRRVDGLRREVTGEPRGADVAFGYFTALERDSLPAMEEASGLVRDRLGRIRAAAARVGAQVVVVQVPAPAQVCERDSVDWFPRKIDLQSDKYDLDQPQRLTTRICDDLGLPSIDLRPALRAGAAERPCQPKNLHWTKAGHRIVAEFVADQLLTRKLVR